MQPLAQLWLSHIFCWEPAPLNAFPKYSVPICLTRPTSLDA